MYLLDILRGGNHDIILLTSFGCGIFLAAPSPYFSGCLQACVLCEAELVLDDRQELGVL